MQVAAVSIPGSPGWRWRVVNYAGEMIEESHEMFPTISIAVAHGKKRQAEMDVVDRSVPNPAYRPTPYLRGRS
jgi:hypothetical protein